MRSVGRGAIALLLALACGCNQTGPNNATEAKPQPSGTPFETVGRLHWLGKARLAADTNAAHFLAIWNLPEAGRLQDQTLDKLVSAFASWFSYTNPSPAAPNRTSPTAPKHTVATAPQHALSPTASLLRPLLTDLVEEESYVEVGSATNQPGELLLAIHLKSDRASVWQTNLSSALSKLLSTAAIHTNGQFEWDLTRSKPRNQAAGAAAPTTNSAGFHPQSVHLDRQGDWTVLSLTCGPHSPFLSNALAQIKRDGAPFTAPATNYWLDTAFDLPAVARALSLDWHLPANWPKIVCTVHGEAENVRTLGQLDFPQPLAMDLPAWNIPTNLIHDPLISFGAVRGVGHLLSSLPLWKELGLKTAPDQIFAWSQAGMPVLEYIAAPWPDAGNVVRQLTAALEKRANPWLASNTMGHITNSTTSNGLIWQSAPFVTPQVESISETSGDFVLAGLVPLVRTNLPPPQDLMREFASGNRWAGYAWEITGPKLDQLLYVTQLARLIGHREQMPPQALGVEWLKAAAPKLGNCVSVLSLDSPSQISFRRKSSLGLDAFELHVLADWLESPHFPQGTHTLDTPPLSKPSRQLR